jgi:hypothetical protein
MIALESFGGRPPNHSTVQAARHLALIRGRPPNSRSRRCAASDVQSARHLVPSMSSFRNSGRPPDTVNQVAACNRGAVCASRNDGGAPPCIRQTPCTVDVEFFADMGRTKLSQRSLSRKSRPGISVKMPWNVSSLCISEGMPPTVLMPAVIHDCLESLGAVPE